MTRSYYSFLVVFFILFVGVSCHKKMSSYRVKPRDKKDADWVVKVKDKLGLEGRSKSKKKASSGKSDKTFGPLTQGKRKRMREEGLFPKEMRK